ncbi:elongation factor 1-beta' isoform X2 [Zootermopsis nevadensis]|uniref:Elongation factor 1-beta n=1 Tax=Zootermopsis nevadensis TaxID=136037 RepID=A0A067QHY5_ZOONE|nr:elongation factor 1-beta' isoform X2 [Zootermopsis nevadensis]KDR06500.1 Elongation factor 1-beta [Zootermopsis nevadensis]
MAIFNLETEQGIKSLDAFLADHSYVEGFQATQADVGVFESLAKPPTAATPHLLRWYNHINSFGDGCKTLPGEKKSAKAFGGEAKANNDDDDIDLFGSDEDDAEAAKIREERLKAYAEKKSKKPALIAKSSIILDVKPWDDETDMKELEASVRTITMDGLLWGASKMVPVGFGIHKLQIMCVVEDEKVSVDLLIEEIQKFEELVQSVDIVAFNKI